MSCIPTRPAGSGREARRQPAVKSVRAVVGEAERPTFLFFNPFERMQLAALSMKQTADREHVLKPRLESERDDKFDRVERQTAQFDFIKERQMFARNKARPFDLDAVFEQRPISGHPDIRVRQSQDRQATIRIPDQRIRLPPAEPQFITAQEATVVIVQAETVSRFKRHSAILLTEKKYVLVLNHDRMRDAARDRSRAGNQFLLIERQ